MAQIARTMHWVGLIRTGLMPFIPHLSMLKLNYLSTWIHSFPVSASLPLKCEAINQYQERNQKPEMFFLPVLLI